MGKKITYEVDIKGHEAPFTWKLYKKEQGINGRSAVIYDGSPFEGDAHSKSEAVAAARHAAEDAFERWCHQNTVDTVPVFSGEMPAAPAATFADGEIDVAEPNRSPADPRRPERALNPVPRLEPSDFMD